ncbi:HNH endonuclease [Mycobacterium koreense]|uniref:HNH endonuclease family protein n=1 Tax=Mycolicibacillus koreensis TaxID=1069220 RepID=UPI000D6A7BF5|nr:HNH endonuclease family protein [Mycolicibacillus koreensis]MCV7247124.1 HNH endonuclease [Mycolicibacillus koreensis]BBY55925.1 hypothetical protein MKOR_31760 [Mycolicibacillus koreensis]
MTSRARTPALLAAVVGIALVGLWWTGRDPQPPPAPKPPAGEADYATARTQLEELPVSRWDPRHDYQRYRFGDRWSDEVDVEGGHNGCNTRDDILRRDLVDVKLRWGTCKVQSGILHDPYTGTTVEFTRGPQTSEEVQIDHIVALSDAWYKGARGWDAQRRADFANDPRNLLAVSGPANYDKAYHDASGWLPPNTAFRCEFVTRQITVKTAYHLAVSVREKAALHTVLDTC